MKWAVINLVGAVAWILGLVVAKASDGPSFDAFAAGDHRFIVGLLFGLAGLVVLLWGNLVNPA